MRAAEDKDLSLLKMASSTDETNHPAADSKVEAADDEAKTLRTDTIAERQRKVDRKFITCDGCNESNPAKRCSGCQIAYYCSKQCQVKHWRGGHKAECNTKRREIELFRERIENIIPHSQCAISHEEPPTHPIILPRCGHVFSLVPLCDWVRENCNGPLHQQRRSSSEDVTCPICRTPIGCHPIVLVRDHIHKLASLAKSRRVVDVLDEQQDTDEKDVPGNEGLGAILDGTDTNHPYLEQAMGYWSAFPCPDDDDDPLWKKLFQIKTLACFGQPQKALHLLVDAEKQFNNSAQVEHHGVEPNYVLKQAKAFTFFHLAIILQELGTADQATDFFKEAKLCFAEMVIATRQLHQDRMPRAREFEGFGRCCYEVGDYHMVKGLSPWLLTDRSFSGFRKYLALSYKATGDLDKAVQTAAEAVLYEAPWDQANMVQNLDLYETLFVERENTSNNP